MDEREFVFRDYSRQWDQINAGQNAAQLISQTANMFDQYYPDRKWGQLIKSLAQEVSPVATTGDFGNTGILRKIMCV